MAFFLVHRVFALIAGAYPESNKKFRTPNVADFNQIPLLGIEIMCRSKT
jgi:hypothetical protein